MHLMKPRKSPVCGVNCGMRRMRCMSKKSYQHSGTMTIAIYHSVHAETANACQAKRCFSVSGVFSELGVSSSGYYLGRNENHRRRYYIV